MYAVKINEDKNKTRKSRFLGYIKNKTSKPLKFRGQYGATGRIRTGDLLITNQLLYRLSHGSIRTDNKNIILQIKIKIHCFLFFLVNISIFRYFDNFSIKFKKGSFQNETRSNL